MTIKITIITTRGATVELIADNANVAAWINGKPHTSMGAKLGHDSIVGDYIALAGNAKAAISPETAATVREFLAAVATRKAEWIANYKLTAVELSAWVAEKMAGDRSAL